VVRSVGRGSPRPRSLVTRPSRDLTWPGPHRPPRYRPHSLAARCADSRTDVRGFCACGTRPFMPPASASSLCRDPRLRVESRPARGTTGCAAEPRKVGGTPGNWVLATFGTNGRDAGPPRAGSPGAHRRPGILRRLLPVPCARSCTVVRAPR
jgi:hypothetical protein